MLKKGFRGLVSGLRMMRSGSDVHRLVVGGLYWSFLALVIEGRGQSLHLPLSAPYTRIGSYHPSTANALSVRGNQASLAAIDSFSAGVYGERKFLLSQLNLYALAICIPVFNGAIGFSTDYFGYKDYNETQIGIGYGKSLGRVALGIRFSMYSLRIGGYGKSTTWNVEAGLIMHVSGPLSVGISVLNPTRNYINRARTEKLPAAICAGFGYQASELLLLQGEIVKEENKPVIMHAAFQYHYAKKLFLRVGTHGVLANIYLGTGLHRHGFRLDIMCSYHSRLGFTPGTLLLFEQHAKR